MLAALLLSVASGLAPAAGAQTDPLRFFPLGDGDAWLFEATLHEGDQTTPYGFERWAVVGDTTIQGTERGLLRVDLYEPGVPPDGAPSATALCAVLAEPSEITLILTFTDIAGRCHNLLALPAPPEYTVITGTDGLLTFPDTVDIGGTVYPLPEVAYGVDHVHVLNATYYSEWWLARDLGLYRQRRGVISADSTAHVEHTLHWARVGGVEYGSIPVANEPASPEASERRLRVWPNPTAGLLYVEAPPGAALPDAALAEVFDGLGRRVATVALTSGRGVIDLRALPRGRYLVRVPPATTVVARR